MKRLWHWFIARRRTAGKIALIYIGLELAAAGAAMLGLLHWLE